MTNVQRIGSNKMPELFQHHIVERGVQQKRKNAVYFALQKYPWWKGKGGNCK
jgi:hypothetical protein